MCLGGVAAIIVVAGVAIAPTIWRYSSYRTARLTIESGDTAEAIRLITRLHDNPFFDLDWTVHGAVTKLPHWHLCYEKIFGCPSCRGDFYTLLYHSAYNGHEELTRTMIDLGASLERWDDRGERVLRAAVISKNPGVVQLVIDRGADVNAIGDGPVGFTALHMAIMVRCQEELITLLLQHDVDINIRNNRRQTPLDYAYLYNTNIVSFLVEHGAVSGKSPSQDKKMHNKPSHTAESRAEARLPASGER